VEDRRVLIICTAGVAMNSFHKENKHFKNVNNSDFYISQP
jgi:hypothetical protein